MNPFINYRLLLHYPISKYERLLGSTGMIRLLHIVCDPLILPYILSALCTPSSLRVVLADRRATYNGSAYILGLFTATESYQPAYFSRRVPLQLISGLLVAGLLDRTLAVYDADIAPLCILCAGITKGYSNISVGNTTYRAPRILLITAQGAILLLNNLIKSVTLPPNLLRSAYVQEYPSMLTLINGRAGELLVVHTQIPDIQLRVLAHTADGLILHPEESTCSTIIISIGTSLNFGGCR